MAGQEAIVQLVIDSSTILLLASLGELLKERAGILNLGVEGIISLSALTAVAVYITTGSHLLAILLAGLAGSLLASIHGFLSIYLRGDQVLSGLAVLFIGLGLSSALGSGFTGIEVEKLPQLLPMLDILTLLAYLLAPTLYIILSRTKTGLVIRGLGDNPEGLDYLGYDVYRLRLYIVVIGGFIVGLAGAKLTLSLIPVWSFGVSGGRGWIALALVITSLWNPLLALPVSHLFGLLTQAGILVQVLGIPIDSRLASTTPYIATIIFLTMLHIPRLRRLVGAPRTLGMPYRRRGE